MKINVKARADDAMHSQVACARLTEQRVLGTPRARGARPIATARTAGKILASLFSVAQRGQNNLAVTSAESYTLRPARV